MLLIIDTVSAACSLALVEGSTAVAESHEMIGRGHAEMLMPAIARLLEGRRPSGILVDCGPGSFTGVRIGIAAARGLAIGWRIETAGYSAAAVLATGAMDEKDDVAVAMEGGHGQLFVQAFHPDPLEAAGPLMSLEPAEAARFFPQELVVGSGAARLVTARGHGIAREAFPRAADAARLPAPLRALPVRPIYGRAPDARPMAAAGAA